MRLKKKTKKTKRSRLGVDNNFTPSDFFDCYKIAVLHKVDAALK